jgi:hypothetical protein
MAGAIWGFTGMEGSGKSADMTFWTCLHLNRGGFCQTFEGYDIVSPRSKSVKLTQRLNLHEWLQMPKDYLNLQVNADEIQNFADSALSGAVFARLMNRVLAQRRKLSMSLLYTVQNWQWTHNRVRWLTHLLTVCQDMYHTPWGKAEGVGRGKIIRTNTFDCKGFYTGEPWKLLQVATVNIEPFWKVYESYEPVNIYAGETKFELIKHKERIDLRTTDDIHRAGPFGKNLLADIGSDADMTGARYTPAAEHSAFEQGMAAVDNALRRAQEEGISTQTLMALRRSASKQMRAEEIKP